MSNCIDFVNGSEKVVFMRDEIDAPALKAFVERAKQRSIGEAMTEEDGWLNTAWWFLQQNSVIDHRGAVIYFGQGRSTHTNRDFDGTILLLSRFMKKEKYHTFFITDEGDGHRKVYRDQVEFKEYAKHLAEEDARIKAKIDAMWAKNPPKITVRTLTPDGWVEGDTFDAGLKK